MQLISAKGLRALLLVVVVGFISSVLAFAQGTNGSLTGQVTDPSGAAIPNASVALTDVGYQLHAKRGDGRQRDLSFQPGAAGKLCAQDRRQFLLPSMCRGAL